MITSQDGPLMSVVDTLSAASIAAERTKTTRPAASRRFQGEVIHLAERVRRLSVALRDWATDAGRSPLNDADAEALVTADRELLAAYAALGAPIDEGGE